MLVACGALALGPVALADTKTSVEVNQAKMKSVEVNQTKMKEIKSKAQKAMQEHGAWIAKNMQGWPEKTKEVAAVTISTYGPPQGVGPELLVWGKSGPWKRMLLHREEVPHQFPMPHKDVLQQFVNFEVPADRFDDLASYDGAVVAERTAGELSARCNSEEANFLALNLAADVAEGRKNADEAREYYANAVKGMLAGKMDPYQTSLRIQTKGDEAGDKDKALFANPMMP